MPINTRAAGDSRHARTGKDGAFYNKDGVMLASVETFTSNVTFNNAKYNVLGDPQEHETAASYGEHRRYLRLAGTFQAGHRK